MKKKECPECGEIICVEEERSIWRCSFCGEDIANINSRKVDKEEC
ncbi:hypothetical protein [Halarsenatibacter silvermanii]|nr:hypothetical protein [Halarsenatibacter silvermanii]